MMAIRGYGEQRCELCCVEEQLEYAKKLSVTIPDLEKRILQLKEEK